MAINNKIDFALVISAKNANPNGDPLNGNRPRINYDGYGEISDVCLKRKIRNRFMDMGLKVFVQSDDNKVDNFNSLKERAKGVKELEEFAKIKDEEGYAKCACSEWIDVRSFGQVFAFKSDKKGDGVSVGIRGPVTIQSAFSAQPVLISSIQITKSVNSEPGTKKASDTMGMKHRVDFGLYTTFGSINCQLADKTGFGYEEAEQLKDALKSLFVNDCSSARPEGSMEVVKLVWWKHNNKYGQYSSAQVHRLLQVKPLKNDAKCLEDFEIEVNSLDGLDFEIYEGV